MDKPENEGEARGCLAEHVSPPALNTVTPKLAIDTALALLAPGARLKAPRTATDSAAAILFDNRVAPFTVRAWRMGMRSMPAWARDMLAAKLEAGARRYTHAAMLAAATATGRGNNWDPTGATLRAWRQARRQSSP